MNYKPKKVSRIVCPKCGELQAKIYPWANIRTKGSAPVCLKCLNNEKLFVPDIDRLGMVEK